MQVHLEVADDEQLRKAVRDLIKGQVTSILAGEGIGNIVKESVEQILGKDRVNKEIEKEIKSQIRSAVTSKSTFFIEPNTYVRRAVSELVESMVKDLITAETIQTVATKVITEHVKGLINA